MQGFIVNFPALEGAGDCLLDAVRLCELIRLSLGLLAPVGGVEVGHVGEQFVLGPPCVCIGRLVFGVGTDLNVIEELFPDSGVVRSEFIF